MSRAPTQTKKRRNFLSIQIWDIVLKVKENVLLVLPEDVSKNFYYLEPPWQKYSLYWKLVLVDLTLLLNPCITKDAEMLPFNQSHDFKALEHLSETIAYLDLGEEQNQLERKSKGHKACSFDMYMIFNR